MMKKTINAAFVLFSLLAIIGILELASGPYFGFAFTHDRNGSVFRPKPEAGSPAALLLLEHPAIAGSTLTAIERVPIVLEDFVEDPDYLGDRSAIMHFFATQKLLWNAVKSNHVLKLELMTDHGETLAVSIQPRRMGLWKALSRSGLMLFLGSFSLLSGFIVARRRPRDGNAVRFFLMTLSVMLIFSSFGIYTARDIVFNPFVFRLLFIQNTVAFVSFFILFPLFFSSFPRKRRFLSYTPVKFAIPVVSALALILSVSRIFGSLSNLFFLLALIFGTVALLSGYIRARSLIERYQIRWIFWGTLTFVLVFCATAIVPSLVFGHRLVSDRIPSLFFTLVPLSILFAIEKYHLMDIDRIVDSALAYLLSLALLSAIDLLLFFLIRSLIPDETASSVLLSSLIVCWLFILVYNPVRQRILHLIRILFRHSEPDPVLSMENLSKRLANSGTTYEACWAFGEFLVDEFGSTDAQVSLRTAGTVEPHIDIAIGERFPVTFDRIPERPVFLHSLEAASVDPGKEDAVLIPIGPGHVDEQYTHTAEGPEISGYIILGSKKNHCLYSSAELSLLQVLADEFAIRTQSFITTERAAHAEQEIQREKERIARDIHDGLGSALSMSLLLIGKLGENPRKDEISQWVPELRHLIGGSLSELRTLVWTMSEKDSDYESLTQVIRSRLVPPVVALGFRCSVRSDADTVNLPLGSAERMHLYRITQEFLANCAKYSEPGSVSITFEREGPNVVSRFRCPCTTGATKLEEMLSGGMGTENFLSRTREMGARFIRETATTGSWGFDLLIPLT